MLRSKVQEARHAGQIKQEEEARMLTVTRMPRKVITIRRRIQLKIQEWQEEGQGKKQTEEG
jgi:hypothetical protein